MTLPADVWFMIGKNLPDADLSRAAQLCKSANQGARRVARDREASLAEGKKLHGQAADLRSTILAANKRLKVVMTCSQELKKHKNDPAWKYQNRTVINNLAAQLRDLSATATISFEILMNTIDAIQSWIEDVKQENKRLKEGRRLPGETEQDFSEKKKNMKTVAQVAQSTAELMEWCIKALKVVAGKLNDFFLDFYSFCSVRIPAIKFRA